MTYKYAIIDSNGVLKAGFGSFMFAKIYLDSLPDKELCELVKK